MDLVGPLVTRINPTYVMHPGSVGSVGETNTYVRLRRSEALQPIKWMSYGKNPGSNVKNGWQNRLGGRLTWDRGGGLPHRYVVGKLFQTAKPEPREYVPVYGAKVSGKQTIRQRRAYAQDNFSSKLWGFGPRVGEKIGSGNYPRVVATISEEPPLEVVAPRNRPPTDNVVVGK